MYGLPYRVRRLIAGPPLRLDGLELALDAQLLLRANELANLPPLSAGAPQQARAYLKENSKLVLGPRIEPVDTRDIRIPVDGDEIGARLYVPTGLPTGSPLLVYFHGGGFVVGDIESHDNTCRFLARHGRVRVLSVDYRLAPEHPFPVPVDDALAAFRFAHANSRELGANPNGIAVGGDSAGGNLATVVCQVTATEGGPKPVFQLLFYPATDATRSTRSKELFGKGLFLTQDDIDWFMGHYATREEDKRDPRYSPLLAEDLAGQPPAYLATAGFDPLRDEGETYADRLRAAGVPVVLSRQADLIHGYVNFLGIGNRFREALFEAAGALRAALEITVRESVAK
ncbi:acetyl esterase [Actinocrispum wychmicini]|uniref:Acetyl esterase n=2 Tax=Actinocrispum wychmicini TaxID=1213861 RepID=A0A4R2JV54_9PSEU|nr:acetyl esterase [Actinocrispum wychmicini]